jgi:hypothetical protein
VPVVIAGSVVMALMIGHPEPVKIAGAVVTTLMVVVVVMAGPIEIAESVEYAQVPPPLVVVVVVARYDPEQK